MDENITGFAIIEKNNWEQLNENLGYSEFALFL